MTRVSPAAPPCLPGLGGAGPAGLPAVVERWIRRPIVVATVVSVTALVMVTACSERARPVWLGCAAALAVGGLGPWLMVGFIRGGIAFDRERCRVGERVGVRASLRGLAGWNVGGERGYVLQWAEGSGVSAGWMNATPAGLAADVMMVARGLQPSGRPSIRCDWPFGLVTARRGVRVSAPIIVRPASWHVPLPVAILAPARHGRHPSEGARGSGGDVLGVREYRRGDDPRSVHWVHTARRETLVVRERPGNGRPSIRIILAAAGALAGELDTISAVATSLVESWAGAGVELEVAWGLETRWTVRDPRRLDRLLDAIACVDAGVLVPPGDSIVGITARRDLAGRSVDLEVIVTSPRLANCGDRSSLSPRLWLVVSASCGSPPSGPPGRCPGGGREWRVDLPTGSAASGLASTLAEAGHDPDAART